MVTVYLTGESSEDVVKESGSDEVIFLGYKSRDVRGLKLGAIKKIREIVAARDFLFCIAHRAKPTYVALLATQLPVISVRHNYGDFDRFSRRILVNLFRKRLLILAVSDSVRDEIRAHLPNWPKQQIETLYNRIDVEQTQSQLVSKEEARVVLGLPAGAWIVGNVGRLHHDKDQATLLRGFQKALPRLPPNSLLVVMGSGPLDKQLKQLALELGIQSLVIFTGNVPNAKTLFRAFDVFALTSDHEPFGMVLLEAMAAGLPLICSDCGGGREVAQAVGQLFPLGDDKALAACIVAAYLNKDNVNDALILQTLCARFSDEAAKKRFWNLSFVKDRTKCNQ